MSSEGDSEWEKISSENGDEKEKKSIVKVIMKRIR